MFSINRSVFASAFALAALSWTNSVIAQDLSASAQAGADAAASPFDWASYGLRQAAIPRADDSPGPFGSKPIPIDALAAKRGGDRVFNDNQLKGVVADNHASNLTTGTNTISDGAFAGSAGLSTVIQNSGNNVLIQNATIVNVKLQQ